MTDLIGRFLSFEETLGRGLVKFAYYVALFYLVVINLVSMLGYLFNGFQIFQFLLVPFQFLLALLILRVVTEVVLAILSIDDNLRGATTEDEGFEAGLTPNDQAKPAPSTTVHDVTRPAPTADEKPTSEDADDEKKNEDA